MSKNKRHKELERLRKLYGNEPVVVAPASTPEVSATVPLPTIAENPVKTAPSTAQVSKDLVWLVIVMGIMLVLLFGLNFLASTTAFGDSLLKLFGNLI